MGPEGLVSLCACVCERVRTTLPTVLINIFVESVMNAFEITVSPLLLSNS